MSITTITKSLVLDTEVRKTTFNDMGKGDVEVRGYRVHREGLEHVSSNTIYFNCPWCGNEVKAYVWSLCGGGKRCSCGAIFGGMGQGYKRRAKGEVK